MIDQCVASVTDERNDISAEVAVDGSFSVKGDEVFLRQAFINLLQNAAEAMPRGGSLTVTVVSFQGNGGISRYLHFRHGARHIGRREK